MLALLSIVLASLYCSPLALGEVHDDEPSLIQARKVKWKADGTPKTSSKNATSSSKVKWKADGTPKTSSKNATSSSKVEWKADGNQKTRTLYSPKTTQGSKHTDNQRRTRTSHAFTEPSSSTPASQMPPDFPIDHVAPSETPGARRNSSTPASQMPPDFPIDHVAPSETPGARRNSSTPASQTLPDHGKFIDIVIGMNETQSVIRFKNPEEILIESNLQNPEASFRDVSGDLAMTVKGPGASRSSVDSNSSSLPSPSSSRRIWVSQGILERLPEEVHLELNTSSSFSDSFQENALLGRDALDAMLLALERVEPISAQLAEAGSVTQQELDGLHHETDLTQSLERVVDGSLDASAREVAKIALKALQDRSTWEANVNESLVAKQRETQFAQQMAEELLAAVQHGITSLKAFAIAANVQVNLSQVAGFFEWDRKETPGSDFMLLERAINVSVEHLRLSQSLADELLQAAAIKDNVTRQMEAALGFKENLTEQLFKKVRLTENLSHSTGLVSPEAEGGASSLAIGTSAFSTSASQAEDLAGQLQKAESTAQAFYKSTLETDLHLKLNQQKLQATLLEGLKTCGHGLRLASQASIQVDKNLSEVFRDVNGVWNAHGQTVESPDPSAAFTPDVVEAPADSSAEDLNQVETTPMFGLPQSTTAQPSRSSLPTFVIALCLATILILSSMIGWVVSH